MAPNRADLYPQAIARLENRLRLSARRHLDNPDAAAECVQETLVRGFETARECLRLSLFEGLKPREIAARLEEPPGRIRERHFRALQRLREAREESRQAHER